MSPVISFQPALMSVVLVMLFTAAGCSDTVSREGTSDVYEWRTSSTGESSKVYLGRKIAPDEDHRDADWMERPERASSELPDRVVAALDLKPSDVVADVGAGTGYFAFRLSPEVPYGRVLAVDIQPKMLSIIRERKERIGADNVEPILGTATDPNLPARTVDVALMVDAYHEFSHPREMMKQIVDALVPRGRVVLVEYRKEDPTLPVDEEHRMSDEQIRREMSAVGLRWVEARDILPQQHFLIFEKEADDGAR